MEKDDVIHTHTHTHTKSDITQPQNNEILPFATMWMDLEHIMLKEMSDKDKNSVLSLVFRI